MLPSCARQFTIRRTMSTQKRTPTPLTEGRTKRGGNNPAPAVPRPHLTPPAQAPAKPDALASAIAEVQKWSRSCGYAEAALELKTKEVETLQAEVKRLTALTQNEQISILQKQLDTARREIECHRAFANAAIAERDYERYCNAELRTKVEDLRADITKASNFKAFVHKRLDEMGIPTHPDGEHSKAGCRIGDRLDIVQNKLASLSETISKLGACTWWTPNDVMYFLHGNGIDTMARSLDAAVRDLHASKDTTDAAEKRAYCAERQAKAWCDAVVELARQMSLWAPDDLVTEADPKVWREITHAAVNHAVVCRERDAAIAERDAAAAAVTTLSAAAEALLNAMDDGAEHTRTEQAAYHALCKALIAIKDTTV